MGNKQEKYSYLKNEPKNEPQKILEPFCKTKLSNYSGCNSRNGKIIVSREWAGVL